MMYNKQIKRKYIEDNKERNLYLDSYMSHRFEQSSEVEEKLKKDIALFNKEEILSYYKSLHSKSVDTLRTLNNQFQIYSWYYIDKYDNSASNEFLHIKSEDLLACVSDDFFDARYISREKLIDSIQILPNPGDKFVILALYEGIGAVGNNFEEFHNLRLSDFRDGHVKLCTGRILSISSELMHIAIDASETYDMISLNSAREMKYDPTDDRILKRRVNYRSDSIGGMKRRIYDITARARDITGEPALKYKSLINSGMVDMIKDMMKNQGISDVFTCIQKNKYEIEARYGKLNSPSKFVTKNKGLL